MNSPVFARHETFHPRHSWIKKGFDEATKDPEIFIAKDAHIRLGVGKNMVRAIRYWCHAFGVLEYADDTEVRAKPSKPSLLGNMLLGADGFDPFLEDLGSLWLLHWRLLNDGEATGWKYAFFRHSRPEISSDELVNGFRENLQAEFPGTSVASSSLRKDANCILRMYGELPKDRVSEESIQCPWAELRLLVQTERARTFGFRLGAKPGLTDEIIAAVCLEYAGLRQGGRTVAIPTLLHGLDSPGLAFKLTDSALYHALENVVTSHSELGLSDTAGVIQLSFPEDWERVAGELIRQHYDRTAGMGAVA